MVTFNAQSILAMNHTHKGFVITSPSGSVSLKHLPLPTYATRELASKAGKASGERFVIVPAAKFYATRFGQTVRALALKRTQGIKPVAPIAPPPIQKPPTQMGSLTNLLTRLREQKALKKRVSILQVIESKAIADTPRKLSAKEKLEQWKAGLMQRTLEREAERTKHLADHSHLAKAMTPPEPEPEKKPLSDSDLYSLFSRQSGEEQAAIDKAARQRKLPKATGLTNLLILWRAGKLPAKARSYKKLRTLLARN
jgi:hypothetical protein